MHYARRQRLGTRLVLIFLKIPGGRVQIDGGMGIHEMLDSDKLEKDEQPLRLFVFVAEGMMT
jgi:hypothetical protein